MNNVYGHLVRSAQRLSSKPAVIEPGGRALSFGELLRRSGEVAGGLAERGLRSGEAALLLLPMSIQLYVTLLGLFRGGHPAVLADPRSPSFGGLLERIPLRALITSPLGQWLRLTHPALRSAPVQVCSGLSLLPHARLNALRGGAPKVVDADAELPALVTFTTGTTGAPKALARTHGFLEAQRRILAEHMGLEPGDVDLSTLPVFLLGSLAAGATCVLPDADLRNVGRVVPRKVLRQLDRWRCTSSSGSPAFFGPIARELRRAGLRLPHLRKLFLGGARVRADVLRDLLEVAPQARVEVLYGSTEAEPIASIEAREVVDDTAQGEALGCGSCVGRPVAGIHLRVVHPGGGVTALQDGEIGEVVVAGPNVSTAYFRDPIADAATKVRDGARTWHRTGDAGYLDPRGRLWLVGRVKDVVAGRHPFTVEGVAESMEFIERAALVEVEGEAVLACAVRARPRGWSESLRERTGVDRVVELSRIPVDPRHNAKVDRARTRGEIRRELELRRQG